MLTVSFLVSCGEIKSPELAEGTYSSSYEQADETLLISSDGHYMQIVKDKRSGETIRSKGEWALETTGYIAFKTGFMMTLDGLNHPRANYQIPEDGRVIYPIYYTPLGQYIGSDEGILYKKR